MEDLSQDDMYLEDGESCNVVANDSSNSNTRHDTYDVIDEDIFVGRVVFEVTIYCR